ncbi:Galactose oxidase [Nymphon striatum]|nr:Galactose oxidase [Nymphon striatum]
MPKAGDLKRGTVIEIDGVPHAVKTIEYGMDEITALLMDGNILGVELPSTVSMQIVETSPRLKGASATNRTKPAILTTGIEVQVPEYLENALCSQTELWGGRNTLGYDSWGSTQLWLQNSPSNTSFAHGNTSSDTNNESNDVVEHAKEDAYWAELAKDYPPFVLPQQAERGEAKNISVEGSWGPILEWPHIPVTAANLPDGRVLTFASNRRNKFTGSNGKEYTYAATWNPDTGNFVERDHPSHDMFCSHLAMLEDGRIIINGGTNRVTTTSIFDYKTNQWSPAAPMSRGRWYPTSLAMPDGSVFTSLGTGGGQYPELWTEEDGWKVLTGASMQDPVLSYNSYYERDWWPLIHVDPKGKVLHSGPTPKMHSIDTEGLGSIKEVGPEIHDWYPKHGTTVMYDEGKLLVAGGAISGINQNSTNKLC